MMLKLNYCALYREVTVNNITCKNWFSNFHARRSFQTCGVDSDQMKNLRSHQS